MQVTDQEAGATGNVVGVETGNEVLFSITGFVDPVVQSPGSVSVMVVSTLVGPYGPLLWITALPVTKNGVPTAAEPGAVTLTLLTFTSDSPRRFVVLGALVPMLLAPFGSVVCAWSMATVVVVVKLCVDGLVQVTDQVGPTLASTDIPRDVFWIVCGFDEDVVQSVGRLSV